MTRAELFAYGFARLKSHSTEAHLDVTRLLEHVLQIRSAQLIAAGEASVDASDAERFKALIERRSQGEPIAYLCGESWFFGRRFIVDHRALVPRPDTEILIELAVKKLSDARGATRVLDIGTGSGAIAITLALELPNARVDAIDISSSALALAKQNAKALGVADRVSFFLGDLHSPLASDESYDCIAANLPYLRSDEIASKPDPTAFEPRLALDGGEDGIEIYRRLLGTIQGIMREHAFVLLEAAPQTMSILSEEARAAFPHSDIVAERDYAGLDRILVITSQ